MAYHPVNLGIRFLLEIAAVVSMGMWGWQKGEGIMRFVLVIGIPVLAFALWGIFAVPDDPSRSGAAPVPTPGVIRLIYELIFFGVAVWMLFNLGLSTPAIILGVVVVIHYAVSYERIVWLLSQS